MRAVAGPGRWVWGLSGLVTAAVLVVPSVRLVTATGGPWHQHPAPDTVVRSLTVPGQVRSLDVQSYGGPVQVTAGPGSRVKVTETVSYDKQQGGPPAVVPSVSSGRLTLAASACADSDCSVGFAVTVPAGAAVTATTDGAQAAVSGTATADIDSGGGPVNVKHIAGAVTVSTDGGSLQLDGAAGAKVDSGGGPVSATQINGPLTIGTGGGSLGLNGVAGPLHADTDGGPLAIQGADASTAWVSTDGGSAQLAFSAAPHTVTLSTNGGPATITVPGGPYAVITDNGGGPQAVSIATDPAAGRSITVTTGGGPLQIEPAPGHPSGTATR